MLTRIWQLPKTIFRLYRSRSKIFRIVIALLIIGVTIFLLVVSGYQVQRTRTIYLYKILPGGILPKDCEAAIRVAHTNYALSPQILKSAIKDGAFDIDEFGRYIKNRLSSDELGKSYASFTATASECGLPTDRLAELIYKLYLYHVDVQQGKEQGFFFNPVTIEAPASEVLERLGKLGY